MNRRKGKGNTILIIRKREYERERERKGEKEIKRKENMGGINGERNKSSFPIRIAELASQFNANKDAPLRIQAIICYCE